MGNKCNYGINYGTCICFHFCMLQREINNTDKPRLDTPHSTPKVEIMDMLEQPNDRIENEDYPPIDEP